MFKLSENSYSKEILKRLIEAQHLAERQLKTTKEDLKWETEWNGRESKTSRIYRKYKIDKLLVERIKKTIETLKESAFYKEHKGYP